jgi:hypothetical protein
MNIVPVIQQPEHEMRECYFEELHILHCHSSSSFKNNTIVWIKSQAIGNGHELPSILSFEIF